MLSILPFVSALPVSIPDNDVDLLRYSSTSQPQPLTASIMENVPVDIWQSIFTESTLLEDPIQFDEMFGTIWGRPTLGSAGSSRHVFVQQPAILSQVCRTWRHITFGMPEIWSLLFIKPRSPGHRETDSPPHVIEKLKDLINFRLHLAHPIPLKICIDARDSAADARSLIRAILPFSQHWKMIHLHAPSEALSEFLSLTSEDVPILRSFKFYERVYQMRPWDASENNNFDLFHLPKIAPSLRRLCTPFQPPKSLPCHNILQELHLQQSPSESQDTMRLLSACTNLRTLSLTGYATTMNMLNHDDSLVLPLLTTLNLEHPVGRESLLRLLTTPLLRVLRLAGRGGAHARSLLLEFKNLMMRSDIPSLESLHLLYETHNLNDVAISEFLAANAELKELKIDDTWMFLNGSMITAGLLKDITLTDVGQKDKQTFSHDGSSSCDGEEGGRGVGADDKPSPTMNSCVASGSLIPALKRLSLIGCCGFSNHELVTLIQSRMMGRHSLESIYLSLTQHTTPELEEAAREARNSGIETKLSSVRGCTLHW
ncbi:hypothetical protein BJ165DRAFT_1410613 [Panaeolus papilionaceus]|nr:hypothetical protein BJ165DRAFT_1410613 [Panaeolus papilionaceus]